MQDRPRVEGLPVEERKQPFSPVDGMTVEYPAHRSGKKDGDDQQKNGGEQRVDPRRCLDAR